MKWKKKWKCSLTHTDVSQLVSWQSNICEHSCHHGAQQLVRCGVLQAGGGWNSSTRHHTVTKNTNMLDTPVLQSGWSWTLLDCSYCCIVLRGANSEGQQEREEEETTLTQTPVESLIFVWNIAWSDFFWTPTVIQMKPGKKSNVWTSETFHTDVIMKWKG